jgi:hypothetical protein
VRRPLFRTFQQNEAGWGQGAAICSFRSIAKTNRDLGERLCKTPYLRSPAEFCLKMAQTVSDRKVAENLRAAAANLFPQRSKPAL